LIGRRLVITIYFGVGDLIVDRCLRWLGSSLLLRRHRLCPRRGWSRGDGLRLWPVSSDGKAMPLWPMVGVDETVSCKESI